MLRLRIASLAAALSVLGVGAHAATSALPDKLTYQDTFNLEYPAAPFFLPNGDKLVYERRSMDIMTDSTHSSLWQIDIKSKQHRPLLAGDDSIRNAVLSKDGSMLAYISTASGSAQLYVRYMDSGQTARLTNVSYAPASLTWSNDGQHLAFTMFTPVKPDALFTGMPKKPDGATWAEPAKYIEKTRYRADGAGYLPDGYSQVYVLPVTGGTPRQLTTAEYPHGGSLTFSKQDDWIYFTADKQEDYALRPLGSDIYRVNTASAKVEQVTDMAGPEASPLISPDGKWLAFSQLEDRKLSYQTGDIMVMNLSNGNTTRLTGSLDRSIGRFVWNDDSDELIFAYLDEGNNRLARVDLDGDIDKLDVTIGGQSMGRPYTSGSFAVSSKGDIAYTTAETMRPADLALYSRRGNTTTLTDLNSDALNHLKLANVEALPVTSSVDERNIDAWMALPPDFDESKSYPLILEIHGGPHAAYGPHFSMEVQLMAAQGYVVVWSNPRGSSSYGEDFGNLIHHNYPSEDYNDLMDVVDAAVAKGFVDSNNLFITGGSGGGVLTAWSIGKTDRFAAAVVAKPVINWVSFALTADAYPYFSQYWMEAMPWEVADELWDRSPLSLVGNVTTPTLLLTGEADYRTPISESEQFYQALRLQGVDAAMVRIPGAPHGIAGKPSRLIQKVGNIVAWFERYRHEGEAEE